MVICVGEILADMIGRASGGVTYYERRAGGAPFNVACGIAHFKGQAGFVGRVGDDAIGRWLAVYAAARGLAGLDIAVDRARNTTLAFVELDEAGERTFSFYRKDTADAFIDADPADIAVRADIVHVGSLLLSSDRGRAYADSLFDAAARAGKKVSFDMNYRAGLFPDPSVFRPYLGRADIVKLSSDEAALFGEPVAVARRLSRGKIVALTLGAQGSAMCIDGGYAADKRRLLEDCRVALWDVVASCEIEGSLDKNIRAYEIADIPRLLRACPIEKIALNGGTAHILFIRHFPALAPLAEKLPSTSPAHTKFDPAPWRALFGKYL